MNGINTEWVCVHWSKVGREVEDVRIFATKADAEKHESWVEKRWWGSDGDFIADPREGTTVMPRSEWEVC